MEKSPDRTVLLYLIPAGEELDDTQHEKYASSTSTIHTSKSFVKDVPHSLHNRFPFLWEGMAGFHGSS